MMRRITSILIMVCMMVATVNTNLLYAQQNQNVTYQMVEEVRSSDTYKEEYYVVKTPTAEDNVIYLEGKTKEAAKLFGVRMFQCSQNSKFVINAFVKPDANGEFHIKINVEEGSKTIPQVIDGKGTVVQANQCYDTRPGYKAVEAFEEGFYRIGITRAMTEEEADLSQEAQWWKGVLGGNFGYVWKDATLWCDGTDNNLKLVRFNSITAQRDSLRQNLDKTSDKTDGYQGSYVRYLDKNLNDISYTLKNYETGEVQDALTSSQIATLTDIANDITADDQTDYEKLESIYVYLSKNFYYDHYGLSHKAEQYANPYENLYALQNRTSIPNARDGKYATICDGFAAMVIALARMEGIPCRMVNGIYSPRDSFTWEELDANMSPNHWWAEAYVDGAWMTIDATRGCLADWKRTSAEDDGTWTRQKAISYGGFDLSDSSESTLYQLKNINPGSNAAKYICEKNEIEQLKAFLNIKANGITNGKRMHADYHSDKIETWGTQKQKEFIGDGHGRTFQILWGGQNLYGKMNLSGFSALKELSVYSNQLDALDLSGCKNLTYLSAVSNKLTAFDATDSKLLKDLSVRGNPLVKASFYCEDQKVTINCEGGTFAFDYKAANEKPLTIYAGAASAGKVYDGIYDGNGNKVSSENTYTFNPTKQTYKVVFRHDGVTKLAAPVVSASNVASTGKIKLTWNKVSNADKYYVYRAGSKNGTYKYLGSATGTSYTNTGAGAEYTYYYKVKAINSKNSNVNSAYSNIVSRTCDLARPSVSASNVASTGKIKLTWNKVSGADKYYVYRAGSKNGTYKYLGSTTGTSYTNTGAGAKYTYYYKVKAISTRTSNANSAYSSIISRTCDLARPSVKSTLNTSGKPKLTWNVVSGATKYEVWRKSGSKGTYVKYDTTTKTSYTNTSAKKGTTYYYKIKAICGSNSAANSAYSNEVYRTAK